MNDTLPAAGGPDALSAQERAHCAAMAALLHAAVQGPRLGWRLLLTTAACLALGAAIVRGQHPPTPWLGAVALTLLLAAALLGLALRVQLFRMRLDERLFDAMARGHIATLDALDAALQATTGRRPALGAPRALAQRIQGTRTLIGRAALTMLAQTAAIIVALLLSLLMLRGLAR